MTVLRRLPRVLFLLIVYAGVLKLILNLFSLFPLLFSCMLGGYVFECAYRILFYSGHMYLAFTLIPSFTTVICYHGHSLN